MTKKRVFITREILPAGMKKLQEKFDINLWPEYFPPSTEELYKGFKHADAAVTMLSDKIDANLMDASPYLKIIAQLAVGYDNIDVKAAKERNIIVTNTPDVLTESTADMSFALMMAITRRIVEADHYVRSGQWKVAWHPSMLLGSDLAGKTIGILGAGRIGQAMARKTLGFNMKILYNSRTPKPEFEKECKAVQVDFDTLMKESDIVSVHYPLNEQTRGIIDKRALELMKPTAYLITTARGPVIDEMALYEHLKAKRIAGAGMDVFDREPVDMDNPLLKLDNVVVAPHIASASYETRSKMSEMVADNIISVLEGKGPLNQVYA